MPDSTQHTPGPWWVDNDGCIAAGTGDDYVTIAQGLAPSDDCGVDEINANLTVMAVAPELLEALEDMAQMVEYLAPEKFDDAEHEREFNARLARARDAIQKARGEKAFNGREKLATAPELLEALELAANYIGRLTCPGGTVNEEALRVYKAITGPIQKARGEV